MKISRLFCSLTLVWSVVSSFAQSPLASKAREPDPDASSAVMTLPRSEVIGMLAEEQRIVSPHGVQQTIPLEINGTKQWISVRGNDVSNPILLFLHGGPGAPEMPTSWLFQRPWEDYFTVVQWDQRGAGKTLVGNDRKVLAASMSIAQMTSDAAEVVRYLQRTYGKKRIFLLGHSWGSVLGVALAQQHPEWFYAYIGVGQVVNAQQNESLGYNFALEQAHATRNDAAEKELAAIAPYPGPLAALTLNKLVTDRKWVSYFGGMEFGHSRVGYIEKMAILTPEYSEREAASMAEGEGFSLLALAPELTAVDYRKTTHFNCPVLLFEGRHDWTVPSQLAASWYEGVSAPTKKLVWFENSAHMPMLEEQGHFLFHLVTDVRPLANE